MNFALVFNCDYNGLGVIHSLGRHGVNVLALDTHRSIGTRSKYAKYIKISDPLVNESKFIDELMSLEFDSEVKPALFPTNDHWVEAIAKNTNRLSSKYSILSPSLEIVNLVLDKFEFALWASAHNLPIPQTWNIEQAKSNIDSLSFPIAVKSKGRRHSADNLDGKINATLHDSYRFIPCSNKVELITTIKKAEKSGIDVYIQQAISGNSSNMITIGIYANQGELKAIFFGRKIRGFPAKHGDCIIGEAQSVPNWAKTLATQITSNLNYTGIAEIELMEDAITNEKFLIEINPRTWSWIELCTHAGVDLVWLAYQELCLNEQTCFSESCLDGNVIRFGKVFQDFRNVLFNYKSHGDIFWHNSLKNWFKEFKSYKYIIAEYPKDDFKIFVFAVLTEIKLFIKKLLRRY